MELRNVQSGLKLGYRVLVNVIASLPKIEDLTYRSGTDE